METHRRTVVAAVLLAFSAVCWACGSSSSSPTGPTGAPPPFSIENTSAHYVSPAQGGQPPIDMLLFFKVAVSAAGIGALNFGASRIRPETATAFTVTGSYNTGPGGFSGSVTGTLSGTPTSGTFQGVLTATLANGCVASKNYSGTLTTSALNWTPASDVNTCNGASPLTFGISTQAVSQSQTVPTSGTYAGPYSVTVPELDPFGGCARIYVISGTLTLRLSVASNGTVTGFGQALGTSLTTAVIQVLYPITPATTCSQSFVGNTAPDETHGDPVSGTASNFGFTETQTVPLPKGALVGDLPRKTATPERRLKRL